MAHNPEKNQKIFMWGYAARGAGVGGQGGRSCANVRWPCCEKARVMPELPELNRLQRIIRIMLN